MCRGIQHDINQPIQHLLHLSTHIAHSTPPPPSSSPHLVQILYGYVAFIFIDLNYRWVNNRLRSFDQAIIAIF